MQNPSGYSMITVGLIASPEKLWVIMYKSKRAAGRYWIAVHFLALCLMQLIGCGGTRTGYHLSYDPRVIYKPGTYSIAQDRMSVTVSIKDRLIWFELRDSSGKELLVDPNKSTVIMRWFLFWDAEKNCLWRYSGDIGLAAWKLDPENGRFLDLEIGSTSAERSSQIPEAVYKSIPRSITK